jgi:hypothetical protein
MDEDDGELRRTNIGGRYGSPTFTIALILVTRWDTPHSRKVSADETLSASRRS